jgi:dipeptidyl aminopeptidase/acylaminoacyl peptidase
MTLGYTTRYFLGGIMRRLLLVFLAVCSALPVFSQAKRPFTFEDMMALKRVGEPEISPDGKWVIFSIIDVNLAADTTTPHVWIVPLAGGQEREIIFDQDAHRPRWAPDGKHFAFISTKEGGSQVWIADFDGTAGTVTGVHKLTSIATEADGELWSPDGKSIVFTSNVYPECGGAPAEEEACNAKKLEEAKNSKVKAQIFTHLLYRHWNAYRNGKRSHILVVSVDACVGTAAAGCPAGATLDLTPGDYEAPVFSLGGQDNYAFSPDGKELCYTSNHDKNPAASTNNDLWIVPVLGADAATAQVIAETKNITADNPASDSSPLYSPDGKYIAYRAQKRPGDESDRFRLMLYDRATGEKKNYTETFDNWVGTFVWAPNSRRIYFNSEIQGIAPIFKLDLTAPVPKPVLPKESETGYSDGMAVTSDGKTLVFTRMSLQFPNEIATLDLSSQAPVQFLTHMNEAVLSQVSMAAIEPFWFTGAHDQKVEGFLVKPPNFDPSQKYPLKFILHGGPEVPVGDEWSYRWNSELFAASGYVVIEINFHGSPGYGQKFTDSINGDWGGAPFEDLMKGLDYAEEHYGFIDKDRECALGASYGGYMANWILGHPNHFRCIVTHDGMYNAESAWGSTEEIWFNNWEFKGTPYDNREMYQKWSPHQYAKNFRTPTLVVHGQLDYRLDVSEGLQLFTTLQMLGVPSKMLYFPDEGHWVLKPQNSQLWYKTVNDWVDQWTKKQ